MNMGDMKEKLKKVGNSFFLQTFYRIIFQKTPNLPKKLDKFNNYIQQNFKVTDDKVCFCQCMYMSTGGLYNYEANGVQVKKQLWEFAQKARVTK